MRQVVWVFLWAAPAWVLVAHGLAWWLRRSQLLTVGAHVATTLAAAVIAWMFLVRLGVGDAQFERTTDARAAASEWLVMWPTLLLLLGAAGSVLAMATLFVACDRQTWRWLPVTLGGGGQCALGLAATFCLAPTA